jgi:hypothetical protein
MEDIYITLRKINNEIYENETISGGDGSSFKEAIILDENISSWYVSEEIEIIRLIGVYNNKIFDPKRPAFHKYLNGRHYDILRINEETDKEDKFRTDIYFDVTDCLHKKLWMGMI